MRWLRCIALLATSIAALPVTGCMQIPAYRRPAGYSSTYHRHLREAERMMYGEIIAVTPPEESTP